MLNHISIKRYYRDTFSLIQQKLFSLDELESMLPFEKEIYQSLLIQSIAEENERIKKARSS